MILSIECTAHTFGIGVFHKNKILSNVKDMYQEESGGIIPINAAAHHKRVAPELLKKALEEAHISENQIEKIAYSAGPGLPPCLWEGYRFAKALSERLNIPLIPVNHCIAHIEIGKFATGFKDPLVVYVSGGNTQIIGLENGRYRIFGETLDVGIGNAIDKFARELDLPMPGGPEIQKLASEGKNYIELPYSVKGMDLVFSGLITRASELVKISDRKDICYSFQETAFSMLAEVAERALAHTQKKELILTGGVAQNKRLQKMLSEMCKTRKVKFGVPERQYCGDNGAQIAYAGSLIKKPVKMEVNSHWRTEDVEIDY